MGPAPVGLTYLQHNSLPSIEHALEIGKHTVLGIARPVDSRQAKDGAGKCWMAHDSALGRYLVIVVHPALWIIVCLWHLASIWIELFAQRRVLSDRSGIDVAVFTPVDPPERSIHVLAAGHYHTSGHTGEGCHEVDGVSLMRDHHVQHDFGLKLAQVGGIFQQ